MEPATTRHHRRIHARCCPFKEPTRLLHAHIDAAMTHRMTKVIVPVGTMNRVVSVEVLYPRYVYRVVIVPCRSAAAGHVLQGNFGPNVEAASDCWMIGNTRRDRKALHRCI